MSAFVKGQVVVTAAGFAARVVDFPTEDTVRVEDAKGTFVRDAYTLRDPLAALTDAWATVSSVARVSGDEALAAIAVALNLHIGVLEQEAPAPFTADAPEPVPPVREHGGLVEGSGVRVEECITSPRRPAADSRRAAL